MVTWWRILLGEQNSCLFNIWRRSLQCQGFVEVSKIPTKNDDLPFLFLFFIFKNKKMGWSGNDCYIVISDKKN